MTTIQFKPFFKKTFLILLICGSAFASKAQDVEQESLDWSKLRVRTFVNIPIPYTETKDIKLASILTIQGAYEIGTLADVRAAAHLGTFKGVSVGGTYHMSDGLRNGKTRFIVAETGDKTYFYKGYSDYRSIFGPSVDLMAGVFQDAGFYARLQAGVEWQTHSRAYYKGYKAMRNGISTVKLQAVAASLAMAEYHNGAQDYVRRLGLGGVAGINYDLRPWKRITFSGGVDLGYMVLPGVENDLTNGIENSKGHPILEVKIGASVKL